MSTAPLSETQETRLRALERELGDFSYIVSHDLAASFRHISGFLGLLSCDPEISLSESQRCYFGNIQTAAEKCQAMLDNLLIYSRVQQAPLDIEPCDGNLMIDAARLQLGHAIRENHAEIIIGPLGRVRADSALLTMAFKHIIDNAVKFHAPDVALRVEIRPILDGPDWVVHILDNGIGVPAAERDKIFRMFYRVTPEGPYDGVGAGLSIARRIMRRHGGEVRLLDAAEGACVEMRLPPEARIHDQAH